MVQLQCGLMTAIEGEGRAGFTDRDLPVSCKTRGRDVRCEACMSGGNQWTGRQDWFWCGFIKMVETFGWGFGERR
jgi:hypothetical protein